MVNQGTNTPVGILDKLTTLETQLGALQTEARALQTENTARQAEAGAAMTAAQSVATAVGQARTQLTGAISTSVTAYSNAQRQRESCPRGMAWDHSANGCRNQYIKLGTTTGVQCTSATVGMVLMNPANNQLQVCKAGQNAFSAVSASGVGTSASAAGTSCQDIRNRNIAVSSDNSGTYWVQYPGANAPAQVTCDFRNEPATDLGGTGLSREQAALSCERIAEVTTSTAATGRFWVNAGLSASPPNARNPRQVTCNLAQLRIFVLDGSTTTNPSGVQNVYAYLTANTPQNSNRLRVRVRMPNNAYSAAASTYFSVGDLVMVHQTQYYDQKASAGRYEYLKIQSISGDTLVTTSGLSRAYRSDRRNQAMTSRVTQVIKVVTGGVVGINSGASLTAAQWDGSTGGVISVYGYTVNVAGSIDGSCTGFRGGLRNPRDGCGCRSHPTAGYSGESWTGPGRRDGNSAGFGCCGGPSNVAPAGYRNRALNNGGGGGGGSGACHGGGGAGGGNGDFVAAFRCPNRCGHRGQPGDGSPECTRPGSWSKRGDPWVQITGNPNSYGRVVANEGGSFRCTGWVIYGRNNGWSAPIFVNNTNTRCVHASFFNVDPIPGTQKQCRCGNVAADLTMNNLVLGGGGGGGNGYSPLCSGTNEYNDGGNGGAAVIVRAGSGGVTIGGTVRSNGCQGRPVSGSGAYNWWIRSNSQDGSGGGGAGGSIKFESRGRVNYGANKVQANGGGCGADTGWGPRPHQMGGHGSYGRVHIRAPAAAGTLSYRPMLTTSRP